ncbi:MAG: restriction endonuclease subunit S [Prevotella sp.]|nr:restriction endonuclease subunit S [Prevotella sp.]MBR3480494.1 restriction endonuclease subunit S [Prevotella sp.]
MRQYDSYKDSGVEWIGKIPSHWEVAAFKRKITINNGRDYKEYLDDELFPVMGSGGCFAYCSKYMYDGEAVLLGRKGTIDRPLYIKGKFWAVDTMFYAVPKKDLNCKFAYYLALTFPFNYYSTATALPSMTQTDLGSNPVAFPPLIEQQTIATYLDKKCVEIDKAIATQQKRIELLQELRQNIITHAVTRGINPDAPLKESGVEWIGMIPEHWEIMKMNLALKSISDVNHYMPNSVLEGYPYIMTGDLKAFLSEIDFDCCKQISEDDFKELSIKSKAVKGDVIFARYATIGTVCYVDIDKEFIVSYSCVTIKPNSKMLNGLFLYYYLQTHTFFEDVSQSINANTQGNVGIESLSASRIIVPPMAEQQDIVSHIESETAKLDRQVAKANRQISLLQELKQSIITEVVTGKRKVC